MAVLVINAPLHVLGKCRTLVEVNGASTTVFTDAYMPNGCKQLELTENPSGRKCFGLHADGMTWWLMHKRIQGVEKHRDVRPNLQRRS
jgi:hypothetical protein